MRLPSRGIADIHTHVRKSRDDDVILEITKNADSNVIKSTIKKTLGPELIRKKSPKMLLEIKNIDPTIDEEELKEIAANKLGITKNEIVTRSLKTMYSGN